MKKKLYVKFCKLRKPKNHSMKADEGEAPNILNSGTAC